MVALGSSQTMSAEDALRQASEQLRIEAKQRADARKSRSDDRERRALLLRFLDAGCGYDGRGSDDEFTRGWMPILRNAASAWSNAAPSGSLQCVEAALPAADRLMLAVFRLALRGAPDEALHAAIRTAYSELRTADCPTTMHNFFWILRGAVEQSSAPEIQAPRPSSVASEDHCASVEPQRASDRQSTVRVVRRKDTKTPKLEFESRLKNGHVEYGSITGRTQVELFLALATLPKRAEARWDDLAVTLQASGASISTKPSLQRLGRDLHRRLPPSVASCWNQSNSGVRLGVELVSGLAEQDEWLLRLID